MLNLTKKTTAKEMLAWLERDASKNEIQAICLLINRKTGGELPEYGTKSQLLCGLEDVDRDDLADAIDEIFPDSDGDEEEEDDDDDDDEEDDDNEE